MRIPPQLEHYALRTQVLDFVPGAAPGEVEPRLERDACVQVSGGRFASVSPWSAAAPRLPTDLPVFDARRYVAAPGFIDAHIHLPQIDVIASPAPGLLQWLTQYTFAAEAAWADPEVCAAGSRFFLDELARQGTTSACVFGSVHAASVDALFQAAGARGQRLVAGKCLMDAHCPEDLRDTAEGGVIESAELAARWHGRGRLSYAITPRYAGSSSREQLHLAGELARARPELYLQSHLAENRDEIRWIAELFPEARSYLDVYDRAGLLGPRSIYAHCLWLDETDRARMAGSGALAAVCPSSNFFLGSGLFDFSASLVAGMGLVLASDVGGGQSWSMFEAMRGAHAMGRLQGRPLSASQLWYWASTGAAQRLGWSGQVGRVASGYEADFLLLDAAATPVLARRTTRAASLEEWLFAFMILGDDRAVHETFLAGRPSKPQDSENSP
jgi:guanine deaminase